MRAPGARPRRADGREEGSGFQSQLRGCLVPNWVRPPAVRTLRQLLLDSGPAPASRGPGELLHPVTIPCTVGWGDCADEGETSVRKVD